jgi:hypothetical protein
MRNIIRFCRQRLIFLGTAGLLLASVTPVATINLTNDPFAAMNAWGEHCQGARWSFSPWLSANA